MDMENIMKLLNRKNLKIDNHDFMLVPRIKNFGCLL